MNMVKLFVLLLLPCYADLQSVCVVFCFLLHPKGIAESQLLGNTIFSVALIYKIWTIFSLLSTLNLESNILPISFLIFISWYWIKSSYLLHNFYLFPSLFFGFSPILHVELTHYHSLLSTCLPWSLSSYSFTGTLNWNREVLNFESDIRGSCKVISSLSYYTQPNFT